MYTPFHFLSLFTLFSLLFACVTPQKAENLHALDERFSASDREALLDADLIFLGEIHDNPEHHQLQAAVLRFLVSQKKIAGVYFEQLHRSQQSQLDKLKLSELDQASELLSWSTSGWPDFALYRPVFEVALQAGIPLIAANIEAKASRAIYSQGYRAVFTAQQEASLGLDQELAPQAQKALVELIVEGHCRLIQGEQALAMLPIQRARDAAMALTFLERSLPRTPAVFIVGSQHARKDFGIPAYIKGEKLRVWSLALEESEAPRPDDGAFDMRLKTAAPLREDPCIQLKEKMLKRPPSEK